MPGSINSSGRAVLVLVVVLGAAQCAVAQSQVSTRPTNRTPLAPQVVVPPINVTVTAPAKAQAEIDAETRARGRELDLQQDVADSTRLMAWLGALQVALILGQGWLSWAIHQSSLKSLRPWVSLETLVIAAKPRGEGRMVVLGLRNSGGRPARILEANVTVRDTSVVTVRSDTTLTPLRDVPDEPVYDSDTFVPPAILVAGELTRWRHVVKMTTGENFSFLTISPGEKCQMWVYGYVRYVDLQQPTKIREYRFGREYDAILSAHLGRFAFRHVGKPRYNLAT